MIVLKDLAYEYPQAETPALAKLNLEIGTGSFVALMGSNGAGKSTLCRCLGGILQPTSGSIQVDGIHVNEVEDVRSFRKKIGLIFQDPHHQLTSMTVERELAFGLENFSVEQTEMKKLVAEQARRFDLNPHAFTSSLSGGEKQLLAIASVLLLRPEHIVLDEATSLISMSSRQKVMDLIKHLHAREGKTVILVTQFPSEAMCADRLVVLHTGRVVFDGPPDAVFSHADELMSMGISVPLRTRLFVAQ